MFRAGLSLSAAALLLSGCGISNVVTNSGPETVSISLSGRVHGGQQPVVGAHVYLYQAGTAGNAGAGIAASSGNASTSLLSAIGSNVSSDGTNYYVTTDTNGGFSITGDYACTPGTQLYLYATGGNPGAGNNSHAGFIEGAGACPAGGTTLSPTSQYFMNEVTTIATAYAMAGFATDPTHISANFTLVGNPQAETASVGMQNAMSNIANLVNVSTGVALATTPGGNGSVPQAELNTLGNILSACVNSSNAAPANCTALFALAASNGTSGTAPTDTAGAAINIAHNAASNAALLYALQTGISAPFSPVLASAPADFGVGISFAGGGLSLPKSIAVDATGNVWSVSLGPKVNWLSPLGVPLSTNGLASGTTTALNSLTLDNNGNVWVQDANGYFTGYNSAGTMLTGTGGVQSGGSNSSGAASDSFGYIWTGSTSGTTVSRFDPIDMAPVSGSLLDVSSQISADTAGNVWLATKGGNIDRVNQSGAIVGTYTGVATPSSTAADSSDAVYVDSSAGSVVRVGNDGTRSTFSDGVGGGLALTVDGNGVIWSANNTVAAHNSAGTAQANSGLHLPAGVQTTSIAIDPSGNLWAADTLENSATGSHITELVGAAAPTVTPLAYGTSHGTLNNALNLLVGFNGPDVDYAYADQFYAAQASYYNSIGKTYPTGGRLCHAYLSWDVAEQAVGSGPVATEGSRSWFEDWLHNAVGNCDRALVTFKYQSGITVTDTTTMPVPVADYLTAMKAFVATDWTYTGFTGAIDFTAWNEPNGAGAAGDGYTGFQVPANYAADYYLALRSVCAPPGCLVAAGDFYSNGNGYKDFDQNCTTDVAPLCAGASYMDTFKATIVSDATTYGLPSGFRPEYFSYHSWADINNYLNYATASDVHCNSATQCTTRAVVNALSESSWTNTMIWDTETAAGQGGATANVTDSQQACATSFLLDLTASVSPRIQRIYWTQPYTYGTGNTALFNSSNQPRPSFYVLAQRNIAYNGGGSTCP